jgi:hypothetical protein
MLSPLDQITRIEARKRKLSEEMSRLESEMDKLNDALEVIRMLEMEAASEAAPAGEPPMSENESDTPSESAPTKLGPPRPSGCPSNFEMVDMILASAEREGKDGLTISELISEMRTRYWPGLKDVQVSAPIYSFVRKGRLKKTPSGKFKRIKKLSDEEMAARSEGLTTERPQREILPAPLKSVGDGGAG